MHDTNSNLIDMFESYNYYACNRSASNYRALHLHDRVSHDHLVDPYFERESSVLSHIFSTSLLTASRDGEQFCNPQTHRSGMQRRSMGYSRKMTRGSLNTEKKRKRERGGGFRKRCGLKNSFFRHTIPS